MKWLKARLSKAKNWLTEKWKAAFIVLGIVLVPLIVWKVPEWQARAYHGRLDVGAISKLSPQELIQLQKDLITAENDARVTIAQIIGGIVVLLGLYATFRNVRVAEEGKLTERFSKAVELLGSEKLDVRLGGIYALERVARDSLKDHWTVMEVLTAFVREQSRKDHKQWLEHLSESQQDVDALIHDKRPPADIQAALTVIGRRKWTEQEKPHQRIDLRYSFLKRAYLSGANLRRALLSNTDLTMANLMSADLTEASLWGAKLNNAFLRETKLIKANLSEADLSNATLEYTKLREADLRKTKLISAVLMNADLSASIGLTWEQISEAIIDELTILPPEREEQRKAEQGKKAAAPIENY
jgi:Pentapeptide repeats (8 copies)